MEENGILQKSPEFRFEDPVRHVSQRDMKQRSGQCRILRVQRNEGRKRLHPHLKREALLCVTNGCNRVLAHEFDIREIRAAKTHPLQVVTFDYEREARRQR